MFTTRRRAGSAHAETQRVMRTRRKSTADTVCFPQIWSWSISPRGLTLILADLSTVTAEASNGMAEGTPSVFSTSHHLVLPIHGL